MSLLQIGGAGRTGKDTERLLEGRSRFTIKARMLFRINTMALRLARYSRLGVVAAGGTFLLTGTLIRAKILFFQGEYNSW